VPPDTTSTTAGATVGATPPRRRLVKHPGRVAIVLGVALLMINLGVILLATADTSEKGRRPLPNDIESISPERGELTSLVDTVSVNLRDDMSGVLVVDGVEIPEDQLERVVELGEISFRPGPDKVISKLRTGINTVVVKYWSRRLTDRPANPPSFGWSFRASA
jgi:hypothetical protein